MAVTIREINGAELEETIARGKVLVKFYSKNCGPCKMLAFVLKDIAKDVEDMEIVTVDFDTNKETVEQYQVAGYPTMIYFEDGQEIERMKGLQQKPVILRMIKAI